MGRQLDDHMLRFYYTDSTVAEQKHFSKGRTSILQVFSCLTLSLVHHSGLLQLLMFLQIAARWFGCEFRRIIHSVRKIPGDSSDFHSKIAGIYDDLRMLIPQKHGRTCYVAACRCTAVLKDSVIHFPK